MKPPRAYARGILHFFGEIRRSTLLAYSAEAAASATKAGRPWSSAKADKKSPRHILSPVASRLLQSISCLLPKKPIGNAQLDRA